MTKLLATLTLLLAVGAFHGCGDDHKDHGHKDHDHKDHKDHSAKDKGDAHGKERALGSAEINGYTVKVSINGEIKAGEEGHVTVDVSGGEVAPSAVRVWAGVESGEGSAKKLFNLDKEDDGWHKHDHIEVSAPLPAGSALWVEVETADGLKAGNFNF